MVDLYAAILERLEAKTALEWSTDGFEDNQQDMPEFKAKQPSLIDGRTITFFPASKRKRYVSPALLW